MEVHNTRHAYAVTEICESIWLGAPKFQKCMPFLGRNICYMSLSVTIIKPEGLKKHFCLQENSFMLSQFSELSNT